jgi:hypothetical protein
MLSRPPGYVEADQSAGVTTPPQVYTFWVVCNLEPKQPRKTKMASSYPIKK